MKPCKMISRCSRRMLDEVWCSWNDVWVIKNEFLVKFLLKKDARRKMAFELSKKRPMKKTTYIYEMKLKWCRFNKNVSASRWRTAAVTTAAVVAPRQMHRGRAKRNLCGSTAAVAPPRHTTAASKNIAVARLPRFGTAADVPRQQKGKPSKPLHTKGTCNKCTCECENNAT